MRGYAAILTGAFAAMISGLGLWCWTKMDLLEIVFLMSLFYLIIPVIFMVLTDQK